MGSRGSKAFASNAAEAAAPSLVATAAERHMESGPEAFEQVDGAGLPAARCSPRSRSTEAKEAEAAAARRRQRAQLAGAAALRRMEAGVSAGVEGAESPARRPLPRGALEIEAGAPRPPRPLSSSGSPRPCGVRPLRSGRGRRALRLPRRGVGDPTRWQHPHGRRPLGWRRARFHRRGLGQDRLLGRRARRGATRADLRPAVRVPLAGAGPPTSPGVQDVGIPFPLPRDFELGL